MLLELYDRNHKKLANLTGIKSPHIQRTLEYGDETLDFSTPPAAPGWPNSWQSATSTRIARSTS